MKNKQTNTSSDTYKFEPEYSLTERLEIMEGWFDTRFNQIEKQLKDIQKTLERLEARN